MKRLPSWRVALFRTPKDDRAANKAFAKATREYEALGNAMSRGAARGDGAYAERQRKLAEVQKEIIDAARRYAKLPKVAGT